MAKYTKEVSKQGDKEVVRYKNGSDYVETSKVPTNVVNALKSAKPGVAVDELGDYINPETDTDESEDEDAPDQDDELNQDDETDEDEEQDEPTPRPAKPRQTRKPRNNNPDVDLDEDNQVPQDEEGMGFKRVGGKTVDIFDGKTPHTVVRNIAGVMVPLSQVSAFGDAKNDIEPKTDAEIIEKLKKLGKL